MVFWISSERRFWLGCSEPTAGSGESGQGAKPCPRRLHAESAVGAAAGPVGEAPVSVAGVLSGDGRSCGEVSARGPSGHPAERWCCALPPAVLRLHGQRRPARRASSRSQRVAPCIPRATAPPAPSTGSRGSTAQPARPGCCFDPRRQASLLARKMRANPASEPTGRHPFATWSRRDRLPGLQRGTARPDLGPVLPQVALTEALTMGTGAWWGIGRSESIPPDFSSHHPSCHARAGPR